MSLIIDYDAVLAITPLTVLWFSMTGLVSYVLGRGLNYAAIKYIGVGRAAPMIASFPLFAAIIAVGFRGVKVLTCRLL